MKISRDRIPDEVLEEIFPKKLKRYGTSERVYSQLKEMILRGKLKKGESLSYERIVQEFDVSRDGKLHPEFAFWPIVGLDK